MASSFAQKCMKNRRGRSSSMWLCRAVISIPVARSALMIVLALHANNLVKLCRIKLDRRRGGRCRRSQWRLALRQSGANGSCHLYWIAHAADVQIESSGIGAEQMVVQGRNLDPIFNQRSHHGVDLV